MYLITFFALPKNRQLSFLNARNVKYLYVFTQLKTLLLYDPYHATLLLLQILYWRDCFHGVMTTLILISKIVYQTGCKGPEFAMQYLIHHRDTQFQF